MVSTGAPAHLYVFMHEAGMTPTKPYKKSARIVGEVLGKYHPHGDSLYMTQPFVWPKIFPPVTSW